VDVPATLAARKRWSAFEGILVGSFDGQMTLYRVFDGEEMGHILSTGKITGGKYAIPAERSMGASWGHDISAAIRFGNSARGKRLGKDIYLAKIDAMDMTFLHLGPEGVEIDPNAKEQIVTIPKTTCNLGLGCSVANVSVHDVDQFYVVHSDDRIEPIRLGDLKQSLVARVLERTATRPIWLDKNELATFVEHRLIPQIERWLRRHPHPDQPIGSAHGIARERMSIDAADQRDSVEIEVEIGAEPSKAKGTAVLSGKAAGAHITIYMNGALSPNDFLVPTKWTNRMSPIHSCTMLTCLPYGIYSILIHEATHAAESMFMHKLHYSPSEVREKGEAAWGSYINDPVEVRAFMQEIVDDVLRMAKRESIRDHASEQPNPNRALIEIGLKLSTTYNTIAKHLSPRNHNLILKAVYDALDRTNLLLDSGKGMDRLASRVAQRYASYFKPGDIVLYGKYKNKRGRIVKFDSDKWGNPLVEIEPIPKGRKQNKVFGLYKIWRADVKENVLKQQALKEQAGGTKLAIEPSHDGGDDHDLDE